MLPGVKPILVEAEQEINQRCWEHGSHQIRIIQGRSHQNKKWVWWNELKEKRESHKKGSIFAQEIVGEIVLQFSIEINRS